MKKKLLKWKITKSGCYEVISHKPERDGYPRIRYNGVRWRINRLIYAKAYGLASIVDKVVMHTCDNPLCIRLSHLSIGTNKDNMADMVAKGRSARMSGERNGSSKLTLLQVREILKSKENTTELSEKFKVTERHIRKIMKGERWQLAVKNG